MKPCILLAGTIIMLALSACFPPWTGDNGMGTIVIGYGGQGGGTYNIGLTTVVGVKNEEELNTAKCERRQTYHELRRYP